jgi:GAF domain-containing protein
LSDVEKQQALNWMLREVVMTNHDLLNSTSMEELWQRAVELARERLDVERCSVFLVKGKYLVGTYGTDHSRRTVDERGLKFVTSSLVRGLNLQSPTRNMPDWIVTENANLIEGDENSRIWVLRKGWLAAIAIRVHAGPAMALFFNDTAISQTPFDPVKQDLIAVYCSLIGNVAERKLLEQQLTQRTHELSKLLDISKTIQSTLQLKPLFRQILQTLRDVLKYDSAFVFERTSNYDLVLTDVEDAPDDLTPRQWPFHPDDIHIARMFETRAPTLITDVAADTPEARSFRQRQIRIMKHTKATGSCLQVPLVVRDEVIGMISIRSFGSKVAQLKTSHNAKA